MTMSKIKCSSSVHWHFGSLPRWLPRRREDRFKPLCWSTCSDALPQGRCLIRDKCGARQARLVLSRFEAVVSSAWPSAVPAESGQPSTDESSRGSAPMRRQRAKFFSAVEKPRKPSGRAEGHPRRWLDDARLTTMRADRDSQGCSLADRRPAYRSGNGAFRQQAGLNAQPPGGIRAHHEADRAPFIRAALAGLGAPGT